MNLSFHSEPFPHVTASFDDDFYNKVNESWNTITHTDHISFTGNRSNVLMQDKDIADELTRFLFFCFEQFSLDIINHYPKLKDHESDLKSRILYSENKTSDDDYKIRGWHLDTGDKLLVGLWYFKHPNEENCGGDLLLMNPSTKEIKKFDYGTNQLIVFPNLTTSWHAITPRKPSIYPRRYINLLLESTNTKLHNYQRTGNSFDGEFRGKLINYYG